MITVYTKDGCTECHRIMSELDGKGMEYLEVDMDHEDPIKVFKLRKDARSHKQMSMPLVYVDGVFVPTNKFCEKYLG